MLGEGYRPVDLSAYCNAGAPLLGGDQEPPVGSQVFHGLPFHIGARSKAFIAFGPDLNQTPVTIPIDATAHSVIVAHRLLGSQLMAGGPIGEAVATYVFRMADGSQQRVPIRERFEIADLGVWGQLPFLARPDAQNGLQNRWSGPWSSAGFRQTEVTQGSPRAYYLWTWTNPAPEVALESIEIVPLGPRFLVAAVTLGLTDEEPFARAGAVPLRIDLKDARFAARPFEAGSSNLEVSVDRGVATYTYQLPESSPEKFLTDTFAGWGERQNGASSPAYAEVAATPSATVSVKFGEETVESVRWGDVLDKGALETAHVRLEIVEDGRNWVETVVLDDATGAPCHVVFTSARPTACPTNLMATTVTSTPTTTRGMSMWAVICVSGRSPMPTSTATARAGCRGARSWSMSPAGSSTSRSDSASRSNLASGGWSYGCGAGPV